MRRAVDDLPTAGSCTMHAITNHTYYLVLLASYIDSGHKYSLNLSGHGTSEHVQHQLFQVRNNATNYQYSQSTDPARNTERTLNITLLDSPSDSKYQADQYKYIRKQPPDLVRQKSLYKMDAPPDRHILMLTHA